MTDGKPFPEANVEAAKAAAEEARRLEAENKLVILPVAIGPQADLKTLGLFTAKRPPGRLREQAFAEFFEWLTESVSAVSESSPGDRVEFPATDFWREEVVDLTGTAAPNPLQTREGWKVFDFGGRNGDPAKPAR
jgi:uncharacterized protein YegL